MSDWDAIFGEAALGLDPAKADLVLAGSGQAPPRRSQRPSVQAQPGPHPDRPAGHPGKRRPLRNGRRPASGRGRAGPGELAGATRHASRREARPGHRPACATGQRLVHPAGWAHPSGPARHPGDRPAGPGRRRPGRAGRAPADPGIGRAALRTAGGRTGPPVRRDARQRDRAMSRGIPCIRQMEDADCGAACLAMVLGYFDKRVDLRELRDMTGAGRDGVTALSIVNAARAYGLRARGVQADLGDLRHLPRGSILHWEFRHFVVFERTTRNGIRVVDPAHGRRVVPVNDLRRAYTGVAIICEPSDDFDRGSPRAKGTWRYLRPMLRQSGNMARVIATSLVIRLAALGLPLLSALVVDEIV